MPKQVAVLDYQKCHPDKCAHGVCVAALECEYGSLMQQGPYEEPEINAAKWCHSCAKCAQACPLNAIRML